MPNFREAYNSFSDFISRQNKIISSLRAEKSETVSLLRKEQKDLTLLIAKAFPSVKGDALEQLTTAAEEAEKPRNFNVMVDGLLSERKSLLGQIKELENSQGTIPQLEEQSAQAKASASITRENLADKQNDIADFEMELKRFHQFNSESKLPLTPETLEYYSKITIARFFSPNWHEARSILKSYSERNKTDIFADDGQLDTFRQDAILLKEQKTQYEEKQKSADKTVLRLNGLKSDVKTDAHILEVVHAAIEDLIFDEKFSAAILLTLKPEQAKRIATHVLKIQNLDKINSNLEGMEKQAKATLSQLEAPHSKLRRGMQNVPYKTINIDLKKIDKSIQMQSVRMQYVTQNSSRSRDALSSYSYSGDDGWNFMQNYFLLYLLTDSGVDPAYMHQTFGIDDSVASDMNIDLNTLQPDFNGIDLSPADMNLIDSFNRSSGLDVSVPSDNFSVDMPQMDMPSIDLPSFEVPSFDIPSFDIPSIDVSSTSDYSSPSFSSD